MTVLDYAIGATLAMLSLGSIFTLIRAVRGPSVLDRILCLNVISILLVSFIAVEAAVRGETAYFGLMVTITLLGFVGTLTAGRFAERQSHERD